MKKRWILLLAAVWMMVTLSVVCAEEKTVQLNFYATVTRGEVTVVQWPDFVSYIYSSGLDDDDFDIVYHIDEKYGVTINADRTVYVAEDAPYDRVSYSVTYTPKEGKPGKKTTFEGLRFSIYNAVKEIVTDKETIVLRSGKSEKITVDVGENTGYSVRLQVISGNEKVATVQQNNSYTNRVGLSQYVVSAVAPGKTELTLTVYNGLTRTIPVTVLEEPTKLTFSQSVYYATEGETVDLGTDFGIGSVNLALDAKVFVSGSYQFVYTYFKEDFAHFTAPAGVYDLTMTTPNGYQDSARIYVYSKNNCVDLVPRWANMKERENNYIYAYDAKGKRITLPMEITKGSEFASLDGDYLATTGYGVIEVTVTNPDGSTYSEEFEILPNPTELILNASEVTLAVGESFQLEVGFDKGTVYYSIDEEHTFDEKYGINPTRMDENHLITAQNPGTTVYTVVTSITVASTTSKMEKSLVVTVTDGPKAAFIDIPPDPFGIGHSYQMYVRNGNGQIVSAVFHDATTNGYDGSVELTSGGYITGVKKGSVLIAATLEDGRVLTRRVAVKAVPKWLYADAVVMRKSSSYTIDIRSDLGEQTGGVRYTIDNPKLITIENGVIKAKTTGKTTVTATSVTNPSVSTTFTVKVISDSSGIYIGSTSISVPCGSARYLPVVTDGDGDVVTMKWEITHNNPGTGNPQKSGFVLEGDIITCTWPDASCEVTGTVKGSNEYVVVTVKGYQLPETIAIEPAQIWLEVGQSQRVQLTTDDKHGGFGGVLWAAENDGIVSFAEIVEGSANTVLARKPGTTRLAAVLENGAAAVCTVHVYDPQIRLPGDVNEDGAVDARDALLVMQHDAGWRVSINGWQGDVNADGKTDLADAVLLFQYSAGLDVELKQYIPQ